MRVDNGTYSRQVTVSIGIGHFDGVSRSSAEELRRCANQALKEAKALGKNQVSLYSKASEDGATAGS